MLVYVEGRVKLPGPALAICGSLHNKMFRGVAQPTIAMQIRNEVMLHRPMVSIGYSRSSNVTQTGTEKTMVNVTGILCTPRYGIGRANVLQNLTRTDQCVATSSLSKRVLGNWLDYLHGMSLRVFSLQ